MELRRLILIIFIIFGGSLSSARGNEPLENMEQLAELVKSAKSVDEALVMLPRSLTQNATLGKCSQGLQEASSKYPRAFMYEGSGKLVVTFNGHPSQKAFDEIETIEFDPKKKEWRLARLKFDGKSALKPEYNPPQCLKCHGNPPQPIWGQYREWPCLYGEDDDVVSDGSDLEERAKQSPESYNERIKKRKAEYSQFGSFLDGMKKEPNSRYKILQLKFDENTNGLYRRNGDSLINPGPRPNTDLTELLGRRQAQLIAAKIESNPKYQKWKNSVAYLLLGCLPSREGSKSSLLEDIFPGAADYSYRIGGSSNLSFSYSIGQPPKFPKDSIDSKTIQALLSSFGIEGRRWTIEFSKNANYYYLGSIAIAEGVRGLLLQGTFQANPDLVRFFQEDVDYDYQYNDSSFMKDYYEKLNAKHPHLQEEAKALARMVGGHNRKKIQESCTTLEKFVNQEILANGSNFGVDPDFFSCQYDEKSESYPQSAQIDALLTVLRSKQMAELVNKAATKPWPEVADACIECHEGSDRVGPLIHFSDPKKLLEQNASFSSKYGYGDLFDAIEMSTDPSFHKPARMGDNLMPLGRETLTPEEKKILKDYLRSAQPKNSADRIEETKK